MSKIAEHDPHLQNTGFRIEIIRRSEDKLQQRVRFDLTLKDCDGQESQTSYTNQLGPCSAAGPSPPRSAPAPRRRGQPVQEGFCPEQTGRVGASYSYSRCSAARRVLSPSRVIVRAIGAEGHERSCSGLKTNSLAKSQNSTDVEIMSNVQGKMQRLLRLAPKEPHSTDRKLAVVSVASGPW